MEEILINFVRESPWIYDYSRADFRDTEKKEKSWKKIATVLNLDVVEVKKKWKNLRSSYVREKRTKPNGSRGGKKKEWVFMQSLSFLAAHVKGRKKTYSNFSLLNKDAEKDSAHDIEVALNLDSNTEMETLTRDSNANEEGMQNFKCVSRYVESTAGQIPETYEFNVRFLAVIEKYPCVYNYLLPEYSNRNKVEKTWCKIASQLNCSVEQCKIRWKHIRNSFLRHLRNQSCSGSGASMSKRPYYLQPHLEFLVPFTKSKKQTSNLNEQESFIEENQSDTSQVGEYILDSCVIIKNEDSSEEIDDIFQQEKSPCKESDPPTKKRKENFEDGTTKILQKENDVEEDYLYFFRSLLPNLKQFNRKQSFEFKRKVLDLVESTLDENT